MKIDTYFFGDRVAISFLNGCSATVTQFACEAVNLPLPAHSVSIMNGQAQKCHFFYLKSSLLIGGLSLVFYQQMYN